VCVCVCVCVYVYINRQLALQKDFIHRSMLHTHDGVP
jgi:hypothetical protein